MKTSVLVAALLMAPLTHAAAIAQDGIPWAADLATAQRIAAEQNRLVLVHFWAPDCPPCVQLERYVFPNPAFAQALSAGYVPVKINAARSPVTAQQFGVDRWPTDVIITPSGQKLHQMVSPQDARQYASKLQQVAYTARTQYASQLAAGPSPPAGFGAPYGRSPIGSPSVNRQEWPANRPLSGPQPGTSATPPGPFAAGQNPAAGRSGSSMHNSFAGRSHNPAAGNPAVGSPAGFAGNQSAAYSGPTAPATPNHGLDGYCPVTLVEDFRWEKGNPAWGAVHRGRIYLFTSRENQQRFLAQPDFFSPSLSGLDPVAFSEHGARVEGKRRHGVFYGNHIYLFADEASLQRFSQAPDQYVNVARQATQQGYDAGRTR